MIEPRSVEIHTAFRDGDLRALRAALPDADAIPNGPLPRGFGRCLEYAVYHSPIGFIRELLDLGADPNPVEHDGFPPLIAALRSPDRPDGIEVLRLLLSRGADPNQRGLNDYTPLHFAAEEGNVEAAEILLAAGADPTLRTRIDDHESALELALRKRETGIAALLGTPRGER